MTGDVARPKRPAATLMDMARSLGLIVVIIGVGLLLFDSGLLHPSKAQRVQPVDYTDDVAGFHQVTGVTAFAPTGLDAGWYVNSAKLTYRGSVATLYIGWVTPDHKYAALYESNAPSPTMPKPASSDRTVRFTRDKITIVITGSASAAEELTLSRSLAR